MESKVNFYGADFGQTIVKASGEYLITEDGTKYFDMFSSAGVANFGHNNPTIKRKVIEYLEDDGPVHALDYFTSAKREFVALFEELILPKRQRGIYSYYFSPPSGTLAMEAAIKYARKATGRTELACFTNSFHGLSYNALSITGNKKKRASGYTNLPAVSRLPYFGYLGADFDYLAYYRRLFTDESSGYSLPAGIVFETIQAEGGLNSCSAAWYDGILNFCRENNIVSIVDEIQVGCGRAGGFFSFDRLSESYPDVICLAKSLSGMGLPIGLVLVRSDLDVLEVGENSGTFRGNALAVKAATFMLQLYASQVFKSVLEVNEGILRSFMQGLTPHATVRGRGMIYGIQLQNNDVARSVREALLAEGVLVEQCGGQPSVLKIMPPLTSDPRNLEFELSKISRHIIRI